MATSTTTPAAIAAARPSEIVNESGSPGARPVREAPAAGLGAARGAARGAASTGVPGRRINS
jgi:hypothetical protein